MTPDITDFEHELRRMYLKIAVPPPRPRVSVPPSRTHPRRRRLVLSASAALAVAAALVVALLATRQPLAPTTRLLSVQLLPAADTLNCSLPIRATSADQTTGFIVMRNGQGSFTPADVPNGQYAYIAALGRWVNGVPRNLDENDTAYYSVSHDALSIVVTLHDQQGASTVFTGPPQSLTAPMGWFGRDIVIFEPNTIQPVVGELPPPQVDRVLLLDPATRATQLVPGSISLPPPSVATTSSTGYLRGSGAMWTVLSHVDGTQSTLLRYDLTTGASTEPYTAAGFIQMVGVDAGGHPLIQVANRDIFHTNPGERAAIATHTLLLNGALPPTVLNHGTVGSPGVANNLSSSFTEGGTVWMASDSGQIWRYTKTLGMQQVASVRTSTQGAPGVGIEGSCR